MTQSQTRATKKEVLNDFNAVVNEAEQLLKSVANEGGEKANALRVRLEQNLASAKQRLHNIEDTLVEKTKVAAQATDDYVRNQPWQSVAIVGGLGVVVGVAMSLLLNRR
jgi:ElaB/YqjD/DUF883 family membrane-anchored ribosome-binding protein